MKRPQVQLYKDRIGEWRWRFVSRNGKTLADSGEGYKRKAGAVKGFKSFRDGVFLAEWLIA